MPVQTINDNDAAEKVVLTIFNLKYNEWNSPQPGSI